MVKRITLSLTHQIFQRFYRWTGLVSYFECYNHLAGERWDFTSYKQLKFMKNNSQGHSDGYCHCLLGKQTSKRDWRTSWRCLSWARMLSASCSHENNNKKKSSHSNSVYNKNPFNNRCQSVHLFGSNWNISTTIGLIAMKFREDIESPLMAVIILCLVLYAPN